MAQASQKAADRKHAKGRDRFVTVSAINVVLHPHRAQLYVKLLRQIFGTQSPVRVHGQTAVMLGSCLELDRGSPQNGLTGVIYKFFHLDPSEPWFNTETRKAAEEAELKSIKIPENLKPHLEELSYVFYPRGHRLYFVSKRSKAQLSPALLVKGLERIVERPEFAKFGSIKFTVEPDNDSVNNILNLARLKMLHLDIYRPNPDDHKSAEEKFFKRMKKINADREQVIYNEASDEGIKPDAQTRVLATIAASNGKIVAKGEDATGKVRDFSTDKHPMEEVFSYNSGNQTELLALQDFADQLHRRWR